MKTVRRHWFELLVLFVSLSCWVYGGVRRDIEQWYTQNYENRAMFLKIPVRGQRQVVHVRDSGPNLVQTVGGPLYFKVGDQVRITNLDFKSRSIRFKVASTNLSREVEIEFDFPVELRANFAQRAAFDEALQATFTEGLTYSDIESAKEEFIHSQFDEFVKRIVISGDTSNESVIEAVTDRIPAYRELQGKAVQTQKKLEQAQADLQRETSAREQLQSEIERRTLELDQARETVSKLHEQQGQLQNKTRSLELQTDQFQRSRQGYEDQLKHMGNLGKQIEDLKSGINWVKKQRDELSTKLERAQKRAMEFQSETKKLSSDLKRTQEEKKSLWDDVTALTSNRKGLEARYIETKRAKESLESVNDVSSALRLEERLEKRQEDAFRVADLYLLSQRLGTFEMKVPEQVGTSYQLRFSADSPNTVKFSEEERRLHELLGEDLKIETQWKTTSGDLQVVLVKNESLQSVKPRESIEWTWLFQGEVSQPEPVSLFVNLVNKDGKKLFLGTQEFTVGSNKLWPRLRQTFSPMSALGGAVVAVVLVAMVLGFRKRKSPSAAGREQAPSQNVVFHKKF